MTQTQTFAPRCVHMLTLLVAAGAAATHALAQGPDWIEQFGSAGDENFYASAPDGSGGAFAGGWTNGSLVGANAGANDAWLARRDAVGNELWMVQFGSAGNEATLAAAADGAGGVFVAGRTDGALAGPPAGLWDAWLAHFDGNGQQLWMLPIATSDDDQAYGVSSDGTGGVFVVGYTTGDLAQPNAGGYDVFVRRYDAGGGLVASAQFGSSDDDFALRSVSDGSGGLYVGGVTLGSVATPNAGAEDGWFTHLDAGCNVLWSRQIGTPMSDGIEAMATDSAGGVFVGGWTVGDLAIPVLGGSDAWLARYDSNGNQQWIEQFGTSSDDPGKFATEDGAGGVYLVGATGGSLGGPSAGSFDPYAAHFDATGTLLSIEQFGSPGWDRTRVAVPDGFGGLLLGGWTDDVIGTQAYGGLDAWLAHIDGSCGPLTTYCTSKPSSIPACVASLSSSGIASASAGSGFTITAAPVPGTNAGLFLYSTSGVLASPASTPFGFLCIASPFTRIAPQNAGGTLSACDGAYQVDFNLFLATQTADPALVAGAQVDLQCWHRDPPNPGGANLTEAGSFVICP